MFEKLKKVKNIVGIISIFLIIVLFLVLILEKKNYGKNNINGNEQVQEVNPTDATKEESKPTEETKESKVVKNEGNAYTGDEIQNYIDKKAEYNGEKIVFLTFDDGPFTEYTEKILDILKENDAVGTFFVQGRNVTDKTGPILKRIIDEKSGIAMHSFTHDYEKMYPDKKGNADAIIEECNLTQEALKKQLGDDFKAQTWRYPGGHMSWKELDEADAKLKEQGVGWVDWNTLNGDAEPKARRATTVDQALGRVKESLEKAPVKDVSVVLMHDGKNKTVTTDSLPEIIKFYKDNNYKFCIFK